MENEKYVKGELKRNNYIFFLFLLVVKGEIWSGELI